MLSRPPREIGLEEASLLACIYLEMRQVEYLGIYYIVVTTTVDLPSRQKQSYRPSYCQGTSLR